MSARKRLGTFWRSLVIANLRITIFKQAAIVALAYVGLRCISVGLALPGNWGIGLLVGQVYVQRGYVTAPLRPAFLYLHPPTTGTFAQLPQVLWESGTGVVLIPAWLPLGCLLLIINLLYVYHMRRRRNLECACGYDLTGNISGQCPECGTTVRRHTAPGVQRDHA